MPAFAAIPRSFRCVAITPPAACTVATLPVLNQAARDAGIYGFAGHRLLYGNQVREVDAAAVAVLVEVLQVALAAGCELAVLDPTPIMERYFELYRFEPLLRGRVFKADDKGKYACRAIPLVPPFAPTPTGRVDVYSGGCVRSLYLRAKAYVEGPVPEALARALSDKSSVTRVIRRSEQPPARGKVRLREVNAPERGLADWLGRLRDLHAKLRERLPLLVRAELLRPAAGETWTECLEFSAPDAEKGLGALLSRDAFWRGLDPAFEAGAWSDLV